MHKHSGARVVLVPCGRPSFDLELAKGLYRESVATLQGLGCDLVFPAEILLQVDAVEEFLAAHGSGADLVIFQSTTFVDGEFVLPLVSRTAAPVLVWSLPEPAMGGRLRLNSLTGGNLASHLLMRMGRTYSFVYGAPDTPGTWESLSRILRAAAAVRALRHCRIAVVGEAPPGFYPSAHDEISLQKALGPHILHLNLQKAFADAVGEEGPEMEAIISEARLRVAALDELPTLQVQRFAQFYVTLRRVLEQERIDAVGVRCWPEFFAEYGAAACAVLSQLNEDGIPAACESDVPGAATMLLLNRLAGTPTYVGDLVHVNPDRNALVFWHCGMGAYSLASERTGPVAGVQPNRGLGFALDNGLKAGPVTISRLSLGPGGSYRLLLLSGEALDAEQAFRGTSVEVQTRTDAQRVLRTLMEEGFEHHYSLVWADVSEELNLAARFLGIPVVRVDQDGSKEGL